MIFSGHQSYEWSELYRRYRTYRIDILQQYRYANVLMTEGWSTKYALPHLILAYGLFCVYVMLSQKIVVAWFHFHYTQQAEA